MESRPGSRRARVVLDLISTASLIGAVVIIPLLILRNARLVDQLAIAAGFASEAETLRRSIALSAIEGSRLPQAVVDQIRQALQVESASGAEGERANTLGHELLLVAYMPSVCGVCLTDGLESVNHVVASRHESVALLGVVGEKGRRDREDALRFRRTGLLTFPVIFVPAADLTGAFFQHMGEHFPEEPLYLRVGNDFRIKTAFQAKPGKARTPRSMASGELATLAVAGSPFGRLTVREFCLSLCLAVPLACNADIPIHEIATSEQLYDEWQDAFEGRKLTLQVEPGLQYISRVARGKNGHLYIPRDTANTILEFDPDGAFVRETSAESASPYLAFSLDPAGNFVFFGPGHPPGGRVTVLDPEDGRVTGRLAIRSWASAILPLPDGRLVTYSARGDADDGLVFELFDKSGRRVAAAGQIDDEALRVFHGRVQTGGVARVSVDGTLIGVHPAKFELVRMSPDLDILARLIRPQGDRWAPDPPPFPKDLDPFDYEPAHEKWWDSFIHIGAPFAVDDSLVLLTLWYSRGMADTANYANLYKLPDKRLAAGLKIPRNGRVVGSGGGVVYVVRNAALQNDGSMEPLELYEYRLRASSRNHPVTADGN